MLSPPWMRTFVVAEDGPDGLGLKVIAEESGFRQ
jgi:hypothetical protein